MINQSFTTQPEASTANTAWMTKTLADLSDGMARTTEALEQVQVKLVNDTQTAMTTAAELAGANIEALNKAGQIWVAGVQDLSHQVTSAVQSSIQDAAGAIRALVKVKSLKEAIDLQAGFARNALAESDRLARASVKLTAETLAPVTERVKITGATFAKAA